MLVVCLQLQCFVSSSTPTGQGNIGGVSVAGEQSGVSEGRHTLV